MAENAQRIRRAVDGAFRETLDAVESYPRAPRLRQVGSVRTVARGVAVIDGLTGIRAEELLVFAGGVRGWAFDIGLEEVGAVLLGEERQIRAGSEVRRTRKVLEVPVGDGLLGRVVDPLGRPLDGKGRVESAEHWPIERAAPGVMERLPVSVPLQTGIKVVDALIPIGRGQRQLILGDRQTGKTTLAVDTVLQQKATGVLCVYCAVGQQGSSVARLVEVLRRHGALDHTLVVVAEAEAPPGLQFVAPYAATSMAEWFVEQGCDVLIVYDDLTWHARAYRALSLLLRRPPGREAYPGDVFYVHARLLERSARLGPERGGGSLSALPIIETEAQNLAAYIPTNLISITDGQVYLSPQLFRRGVLPAVDTTRSVSRVGGKAQLPAYRDVAGELRLSYAQFQELEAFARFGAHLDEETRARLERGRRVREVLKQAEHDAVDVAGQIAVLTAATTGAFDGVPLARIGAAERALRRAVGEELPQVCRRIEQGGELSLEDREGLAALALRVAAGEARDGDV